MPSMNLSALNLHKCALISEAFETFNKGDIIIYAKCGMLDDLVTSIGKPKASEMPGMVFTGVSNIFDFLHTSSIDLSERLMFVYIQRSSGKIDCYISNCEFSKYISTENINMAIDARCSALMSGTVSINPFKKVSSVESKKVERSSVSCDEKILCLPATVGNVNGIPTFTYKI